MQQSLPRRKFIRGIAATGVSAVGAGALAQKPGSIRGFDHVALPMHHRGDGRLLSMINFHRPAHWQTAAFTPRAPAAKPPCGEAKIMEGPVGRQGGRKKAASSVYVRDPDGNLLEFMIYS